MIAMLKQRLKEMSDRLSFRITSEVLLSKTSKQQLSHDAIIRAYTTWAPRNWEWVESLFNEHFLTHRAAPFLIACVKDGSEFSPVELANVWAEQLTWFDEEMKQRHITTLIPPARDFLLCLEAEMQSQVQYLGNIDTGMRKGPFQTA